MSRFDLQLVRDAVPREAAPMRHALEALLAGRGIDEERRIDILTAVGEAIANAIEHAYRDSAPGHVELRVRIAGQAGTVTIDVIDHGKFVKRQRQPHRGFGLGIIRAASQKVHIDTSAGTAVHLVFDCAAG